MSSHLQERLDAELSLVVEMYPDQVTWTSSKRELLYQDDSSSFTLRLSDEYLSSALPIVVTASAVRQDLRQTLSDKVHGFSVGEEVLDQVIAAFSNLVEDYVHVEETAQDQRLSSAPLAGTRKATVIIWLHHLLNTNKRKLALSPAASVSGMTKPGYPGVLIYSGPHDAVYEHVDELKGQNWAAFQVRLDTGEEWNFEHDKGVIEVENLGDVVKGIGHDRKQEFMEAMRMK
nr:hypothetical protein B0A51_15054 [Rachicladosporium sp. CCFEE 5018]